MFTVCLFVSMCISLHFSLVHISSGSKLFEKTTVDVFRSKYGMPLALSPLTSGNTANIDWYHGTMRKMSFPITFCTISENSNIKKSWIDLRSLVHELFFKFNHVFGSGWTVWTNNMYTCLNRTNNISCIYWRGIKYDSNGTSSGGCHFDRRMTDWNFKKTCLLKKLPFHLNITLQSNITVSKLLI